MNSLMNDETVRMNSPQDSAKRLNSPPIFAIGELQNSRADSVMMKQSSIIGSAAFRLPIKPQLVEPLPRADTFPRKQGPAGSEYLLQPQTARPSRSPIQIPLLKIPGTYRPPMPSNLDLMPQSARIPGYAGHLPGLISEPLVGRSFAYLTAYREALISQRDRIWTTEYKDRHQANLLFKKKTENKSGTPKTLSTNQMGKKVDSFTIDHNGPTPTSANSERSNWGSPPSHANRPPSETKDAPRTPDLYAVEREEQAAALSGAGRIPGYAGHERGLISSGLVGRTFGFLTRHREELIHSHRCVLVIRVAYLS